MPVQRNRKGYRGKQPQGVPVRDETIYAPFQPGTFHVGRKKPRSDIELVSYKGEWMTPQAKKDLINDVRKARYALKKSEQPKTKQPNVEQQTVSSRGKGAYLAAQAEAKKREKNNERRRALYKKKKEEQQQD